MLFKQGKSRFRPRRALLAVITTLIATGVGILAFEVALRFTDYRYLLNRTQYPDAYFQKDSELGADQAPNRPSANFSMRGPGFEIFTNSLGCFDLDDDIEAGYILAVGDSATWGFVPASKNWTNVLQSLSGRQVLNCGVAGVGTRFAMLKAKRIMDQVGFPPSLILLLYINNDLNDDYVFPSYTVLSGQRLDRVKSINLRTGELTQHSEHELSDRYQSYRLNKISLKQRLKNNSMTAWLIYELLVKPLKVQGTPNDLLLRDRYAALFWDLKIETYPWLSKVVEDHLGTFRTFHQMANNYGTRLVLFDEAATAGKKSPHRIEFFQQLREELGLVFPITFDAVGTEESQHIRHRFDSHWSEIGNKRAAEEMANRLREAGLL